MRDSDSQQRKELQRFIVREMSRQSLATVNTSLGPVANSPLLTRVPFQQNIEEQVEPSSDLDEDCSADLCEINTDVEDEGTESMKDAGSSEGTTRSFEVEAQVEVSFTISPESETASGICTYDENEEMHIGNDDVTEVRDSKIDNGHDNDDDDSPIPL